jgi:hypothetical protein
VRRATDRRVIVWTLRISLHPATVETDLQDLRDRTRQAAGREIAPFLWQTRGAVLTVRSQGEPTLLTELAEWALLNTSPEIKGFELSQMQTAPLYMTGDWQGHGN